MRETPDIKYKFDHAEASGEVLLKGDHAGLNIHVDGQYVGSIDLGPPTRGGRPELVFFDATVGEPLVKIAVLPGGKIVACLNRHAVAVPTPEHNDTIGDSFFGFVE